MPIKKRLIKKIKVFAVDCPKIGVDSSKMSGLVRIETCRNCKNYCGEQGGVVHYVECSLLIEGA